MKVDAAGRERPPHIVIIGAGFGGLACAKALAGADASVTVIDRRNHNLFQPLLYQVATAALSPADIAEPVRRTLSGQKNARVLMSEVCGVDSGEKQIMFSDGKGIRYDYLVIATGSRYNYFGNDRWEAFAPGLKTVHEARLIRHRLLSAFERAEKQDDPLLRRRLLTFVIIGGGPTGVEMAGAISELARSAIKRDFRTIALEDFKVVLVEAGERLLTAFPQHLAVYARHYLEGIGVEVRTGSKVVDVQHGRVVLAQGGIDTECVVWGAGVLASPAGKWLGCETAPDGRIPVAPDLTVPGRGDIWVIGDTAFVLDGDGRPLPALAQVARQQGIFAGNEIEARLQGRSTGASFQFRNRGNTAVIGRNAAVFDFGRWTLKGRPAWFLWALVHVYLLINFEKRILVSVQWIWRYLTSQRGARIIDESFTAAPVPDRTSAQDAGTSRLSQGHTE